VNAVSVKDKRTVEEVKKKWQWAVMTVKKLEAARLNSSNLTGGGFGPAQLGRRLLAAPPLFSMSGKTQSNKQSEQ
jgi:hypothetical protein